MSAKTLANHYSQFTPEERFRLILAAGSRDDEAELDRVRNAGKRITLSMPDHSPYMHAFHELLFVIYIELLEDAAVYLDCNARTEKAHLASYEASRAPKGKRTTTPKPKGRTRKEDAAESPAWHRSGRITYGAGFLFKVKLEGWKLFCRRLNVSAVALWEQMDLPGLDRLKSAWALIHAGAVFSSAAEMTLWVNEVRRAGEPEYTKANIVTAERLADYFDAGFRERVKWWGGS